MPRYPLHAYAILFNPARIDAALDRIRAQNVVPRTPNRWQISLGVLRMVHRLIFRPETIGTCTAYPVRDTWRARLLERRPLRFPFLLAERAVAPWDFSGLLSSKERVFSHLLGAHHDENQFVYDLEMLALHPGALAELRAAVERVVHDDNARTRWLRDLVVYERYHENLLAAVEKAERGESTLSPAEADDPDISFLAYLRWCAAQPETPAETIDLLRRGRFTVAHGVA